jgi:hypothetical protein
MLPADLSFIVVGERSFCWHLLEIRFVSSGYKEGSRQLWGMAPSGFTNGLPNVLFSEIMKERLGRDQEQPPEFLRGKKT